MQQFLVVRAGVLADGLADPALDPGKLLVAGRQRSGSDQEGAQVLDGLARREVIKCGVAERALPGGELGEHSAGDGALEPVQHGFGPSGADQGVVQQPQLRADLPARAGQQLAELAAQLAAAADPGQQAPLAPQAAQAFQKPGSGTAQLAHNGAWRCRPDGGQLPAARAFRLPAGARAAPRLTVGLGHYQGVVRPYTLQDAIVWGTHDAQTGPSARRNAFRVVIGVPGGQKLIMLRIVRFPTSRSSCRAGF